MSERCSKCGAELFAGQQFCRRCGAAVKGAGGDAPTQILPQGAQGGGAGAAVGTSPFGGGAATDAVGPRQPLPYQTGGAGFQPTSPLVGQPFGARPLAVGPDAPRKGRRGLVLVALLAVFLLCVGVAGGAGLMWWRAAHAPVRKVVINDAKVPDVKPPLPPDFGDKLGEQIERAIEGSGATASPLDESGATVTGTDTVLSKSFEIGDGATFSIRGVSGDVTVTGS